jgi:hypothetical protein
MGVHPDHQRNTNRQGTTVERAPWDYLFLSFSQPNFGLIFHPTWIASVAFLLLTIVLYWARTRALHRHPPYLDMWEWLLWTGVITFGLLIVYAVFVFDYIFVLATEIVGIGLLVWIRFVRFPPLLRAYETKLAKERFFSRTKYARPEATIRTRSKRTRRRR